MSKKFTLTIDEELQSLVHEELQWEPQLKETNIGILVKEGAVTLTGSVPNFAARCAAEYSAKRVRGARAVINEIKVITPFSGLRGDLEIARAASHILDGYFCGPSDVQVTASNGWLTLTGEVARGFYRNEATKALISLAAVRGISNLISIKPKERSAHVQERIERGLKRNAEIDAQKIEARADHGRVILSGSVRSLAAREEAGRIAWAIEGVTEVKNNITVSSGRDDFD